MRINKGDKIEDIELPDSYGNIFKLSSTKGKKVLLTFYRHASCAVCNLRINEFVKKYQEFGNNFTMVGIFHAPVDFLKKNNSINSLYNNIAFTVDLINDKPFKVRIFTLRSYGESLYHSITDASLEFGYENK